MAELESDPVFHQKVDVQIIPDESDTLVQDPQNLTDGNSGSYCVISGDLFDVSRRNAPLGLRMKIKAARPIAKILIGHGWQGRNRIAEISVQSLNRQISSAQETVIVKVPRPECGVDLHIYSDVLRYIAKPLPSPYKERLKKAPFVVNPVLRHNKGNLVGLTEKNFDRKSFESIR